MAHYLEEIRDLLKEFDVDIDNLELKMAKFEGILEEMRRHNGRVIKALAGIVAVLVTALLTVIGYIMTLVK